ncbi:MAG: hypothetical protein HDR22_09130 [Lachnospiraceae bacterium]|nr:hypothetical protein [Lachnospiraceae bacterium]
MWKEIGKTAGKLLILLVPFFVLLPLYCRFFPEYYMDDEYAMYRQQKDYVQGSTGNDRIVILGDSRAKAGFVPDLLSGDCYNLSLGGATPIEGYYTLKEYLANHPLPETVVLSYAPMHYMDVDTLWTRSVYFHTMDTEDFMEIIKTAKEYKDQESILIDNYPMEYVMYQTYMPNKYATALKKAGFLFRYRKTKAKYAQMEESRGQSYYGTAKSSDSFNGEAKVTDFRENDVITHYMEQIFSLCQANKIQVIVKNMPMNEASYSILTEDFKNHYTQYMDTLAEKYETVVFDTKIHSYPNDCFGDADHLNPKGTKKFCQALMEAYPALF